MASPRARHAGLTARAFALQQDREAGGFLFYSDAFDEFYSDAFDEPTYLSYGCALGTRSFAHLAECDAETSD